MIVLSIIILFCDKDVCYLKDILRDIKEKTGFEVDESYWNFGGQPPQIKKYWMENEVIPQHGDDADKYLAIELKKIVD